jgi:hypothetical protein
MKRQGPQVADVKNATTARCAANIEWNDARFVETCIGETTEDNPGPGGPGRRMGDSVEPSCTDRDEDAATGEVLRFGDMFNSVVGTGCMRSITGRSARPKSVERKSDGRSAMQATQ